MKTRPILESLNPWWIEPAYRLTRSRPVKRRLHAELLRRLLTPDRRALVVAGPRQVGKTTLLKQLIDDLLDRGLPPLAAAYFDFSDERLTDAITPREIVDALPSLPIEGGPRYLFLDEISRAPGWDLWLKQAVDQAEGSLRIVATDSAASLLARASRESGQGRWDELQLEGLDLREFLALSMPSRAPEEALALRPDLLPRYLALGGFPAHVHLESLTESRERLRADIADRAIVRDLSRLDLDVERVRRLFVYLAGHSGEIFNEAARARDLGARDVSVKKWISALLDTGLLVGLDQRAGSKPSSKLQIRRRLYASDHGLISAFASPTQSNDEVMARVFEAVVFRHLRGAIDPFHDELSFYRHAEKAELDFVVDTARGPIGIEVTASEQPAKHRARLDRAGEEIGARKLILVQGDWLEPPQPQRGVSLMAVPLARFLLDTKSILEEASHG